MENFCRRLWRRENQRIGNLRRKSPALVLQISRSQRHGQRGSVYGKQITSIKTAWKKTFEKAGVTYSRPYALRQAFTTNLLEAGVDAGTTAKLMDILQRT